MTKSLMPKCEMFFIMCHRTGFPPISTIGLGRNSVSSLILVPKPPARITAFMRIASHIECDIKVKTQDVKDLKSFAIIFAHELESET